MSQREKPGDGVQPEALPVNGPYEPPEIEDLATPNGPSVTAAGINNTTPAAPRDL